MQLVALGSDPEAFLEDEKGNIVSAIGKIGGTKDDPQPIPELGKGFFVQEDNVLLEYNTPPSKSKTHWSDTHFRVREYLEKWVGQKGFKLSKLASAIMPQEELNHPAAFVFGCEPDFDVWKMQWNPKPQSDEPRLRSAGGHLHIAYDNPNAPDSIRLGRCLDYWIGAPLAMYDPDKRRRELYGRPGAIRFKPYGLEYRTPSNWWTLDPYVTDALWHNVTMAIQWAGHYDSYAAWVESARKFLAGEQDVFDSSYVEARGAPFVPPKQTGPAMPKPEQFVNEASYLKALALWEKHQAQSKKISLQEFLNIKPTTKLKIDDVPVKWGDIISDGDDLEEEEGQ